MLKKDVLGNADLENRLLGDLCRNFLPQMVLHGLFIIRLKFHARGMSQ